MSKVDELRKSLKEDYKALLVKEFTADWKMQRLLRDLEIDVMDFDNLQDLIATKEAEAYKRGYIKGGIDGINGIYVGF
jgi:hypothetical protein